MYCRKLQTLDLFNQFTILVWDLYCCWHRQPILLTRFFIIFWYDDIILPPHCVYILHGLCHKSFLVSSEISLKCVVDITHTCCNNKTKLIFKPFRMFSLDWNYIFILILVCDFQTLIKKNNQMITYELNYHDQKIQQALCATYVTTGQLFWPY